MEWQPIETAPKEEAEQFLVFDGLGVWKAWVERGFIVGFEVDGYELPASGFPPTHWMPLPKPPEGA